MQLRSGEKIIRVIKRHKTPYIFKLFKILLVSTPVYVVFIMLANETGSELFLLFIGLISLFIGIVITIVSLDYLLDQLVITNKRVIWIDWKNPFKRSEHEADLLDIQDIETRETGILSKFGIFDYGFIEIETAASKTCVLFTECPDPEGAKNFILAQMEKQRGGIREKRENTGSETEEWSVN